MTDGRAGWLACREKACCSRGGLDITGADVVRIAQAMAVEPWHFTTTAPAAADDPGGIVLHRGRRRVNLTLATADTGCLFLLPMPNGGAVCGLGDLAPAACRLFPINVRAAEVQVRTDHGCSCREWTQDDVDDEGGPARLKEALAERAGWYELVARWNAFVASSSEADQSIEDFHRYLLEAQTARESGAAWPEEVKA